MIKLIEEIDSQKVIDEFLKLDPQIEWVDMLSKGKQAGLQYANKDANNIWSEGTGALAGLDNPELKYKNLNPVLHDTIFEEIINRYNLVRTRFMWVNPMSCYSIHRDMSPRIHVPIITNPECYFLLKQESTATIEHLSVGNVYWVDTRITHTFMNCSYEPRLHLIGVVTH